MAANATRRDIKTLDKVRESILKTNLNQKDLDMFLGLVKEIREAPLVEYMRFDEISTPGKTDNGMLEKVSVAGADCIISPFFRTVNYTTSDSNDEWNVHISDTDGETIKGFIYGSYGVDRLSKDGDVDWDLKTIYTVLPLSIDADDLRRVVLARDGDDDGIDKSIVNVLDFDKISKSPMLKKAVKQISNHIQNEAAAEERMSKIPGVGEITSEWTYLLVNYSAPLANKINDGGINGVSAEDIEDVGMTVDDYAIASSAVLFVVMVVGVFLGYVHIKDYFPAEVNKRGKTGKKKGKGNKVKIGSVVRMINRRILDTAESVAGGKLAVTPHHKRGYWVTLKAERFRNHPMFEVKNGVYRKESWVGDRRFAVKDLIYKVVD